MTESVVAQKGPFAVEVEAGKKYFWCACGRSAKQPLCDGAHKDTGLKPVEYVAEKSGTAFFCGCKRTNRQPMCDGTHGKL